MVFTANKTTEPQCKPPQSYKFCNLYRDKKKCNTLLLSFNRLKSGFKIVG